MKLEELIKPNSGKQGKLNISDAKYSEMRFTENQT